MLRPICKITFTKEGGQQYIFDYAHDIMITHSNKDLSDTAKITLPRKFSFKGKVLTGNGDSIFNRGDKVKIELGYYPNLTTLFEGYIAMVNSSLPIVIECEDEMFKLKQKKVKYSGNTIKLDTLLKNILPEGTSYKAIDVGIGSYRISNSSVYKVLDELRKDFGFSSYFRNGQLSVGLKYDASNTNIVSFGFEKSIIDDSDLKFQKEEDVLIQVKVIGIKKDNTRLEYTAGDSTGSVVTLHTSAVSETDLKKFADSKMSNIKYTGYTGMFETFGEPVVYHGDAVKLESNKLPERNGTYSVDEVVRRWGVGGYRQFIKPGPKV